MPELAEVEFGRRLAERVAAGRTVLSVEVQDDPIVLDGTSAESVRAALLGAQVTGAGRHGKHLWLELDRRPWLVLHFGMTGALRERGAAPLQLETAAAPDLAWPPRFCKLRMALSDGGELAFTNARRLGRLRLRDDPRGSEPIRSLGFDPLKEQPSGEEFAARIGARRGSVKGLLLDQAFAAGVGNWIADEVLFQAGIDPRRRVPELSAEEREGLRLALAEVVRIAVAVDADKDAFPAHWLFHHRWGKGAGRRTSVGDPVEFLTVAGRTTAWVPAVQR